MISGPTPAPTKLLSDPRGAEREPGNPSPDPTEKREKRTEQLLPPHPLQEQLSVLKDSIQEEKAALWEQEQTSVSAGLCCHHGAGAPWPLWSCLAGTGSSDPIVDPAGAQHQPALGIGMQTLLCAGRTLAS